LQLAQFEALSFIDILASPFMHAAYSALQADAISGVAAIAEVEATETDSTAAMLSVVKNVFIIDPFSYFLKSPASLAQLSQLFNLGGCK
jgi:hypothetical protein